MRFATFAFVASLVVLVLGCANRNEKCRSNPDNCCYSLGCSSRGRCESLRAR
ncbi:hypothetical protein PAXRUDRAFT_835900 [Paxillus rubicundulus Ve08.2h10]|uniref:Uncharacterized protein n=1 Tax=Paxillus rubicundulus Ve08.2h10 TaxID=930991 RepID=A0A0D0CHW4_9AGAM|nr:hypothetical protein PAXRUDRAFT_835900 [Paxillus rubicundulus Ve08.2h10]